jgi:hypothetical protein
MRRRTPETDLESRLSTERPQPADEFVGALSALIAPAPLHRPSSARRVAVVLAVTGAVGASLTLAGAAGSASGSAQAFGRGVFHLVDPSRGGSSTPAEGDLEHGGDLPPFRQEDGGGYPLCWRGRLTDVHSWQLFWYFLHGATSARSCSSAP